eukprot:Skav212707  [mRNA]  locus=scaffold1930:449677:463766:- [translate_table: standard]
MEKPITIPMDLGNLCVTAFIPHALKLHFAGLVWRDLAYWQRSIFPQMRDKPIRAHYEGQSWSSDPVALRRWQTGQTGFPLIDAGMRELWTTGWMAQNVRMAAAILLCEHLNIHWVEGHYIRRWCPELAKLPVQYVHAPWEAPEHVLKEAGVRLGPQAEMGTWQGTYPHRILVDLSGAAWTSAEAIREQRKRSRDWINDQGYDLIVIPRGASMAHDGQKFRVFTKPEYRNNRNSESKLDSKAFDKAAQRILGRPAGAGSKLDEQVPGAAPQEYQQTQTFEQFKQAVPFRPNTVSCIQVAVVGDEKLIARQMNFDQVLKHLEVFTGFKVVLRGDPPLEHPIPRMRLSVAGQRTSVDGMPQIGGHYVLAFLQGRNGVG